MSAMASVPRAVLIPPRSRIRSSFHPMLCRIVRTSCFAAWSSPETNAVGELVAAFRSSADAGAARSARDRDRGRMNTSADTPGRRADHGLQLAGHVPGRLPDPTAPGAVSSSPSTIACRTRSESSSRGCRSPRRRRSSLGGSRSSGSTPIGTGSGGRTCPGTTSSPGRWISSAQLISAVAEVCRSLLKRAARPLRGASGAPIVEALDERQGRTRCQQRRRPSRSIGRDRQGDEEQPGGRPVVHAGGGSSCPSQQWSSSGRPSAPCGRSPAICRPGTRPRMRALASWRQRRTCSSAERSSRPRPPRLRGRR